MVTVATFFKVEDAYLFRAYLEAHEIEAYIFDEHVCQWFWQEVIAYGGIRVAVADEDKEEVARLFSEYDKSLKSTRYVERPFRAWPLMLLLSLFSHIPLIFFGRKSKADGNDEMESEI